MEGLQVIGLVNTVYRKCECCSRVRDNYYKLLIYHYQHTDRLVGEINLCKDCGTNLAQLTNTKLPQHQVKNNFSFGGGVQK